MITRFGLELLEVLEKYIEKQSGYAFGPLKTNGFF